MRDEREILAGAQALFYAQAKAEADFVLSGKREVFEGFLGQITPGQLELIREAQLCAVMATLNAAFKYFKGGPGPIKHALIPELILEDEDATVVSVIADAKKLSEELVTRERRNANN